jgi:hypothetical protein
VLQFLCSNFGFLYSNSGFLYSNSGFLRALLRAFFPDVHLFAHFQMVSFWKAKGPKGEGEILVACKLLAISPFLRVYF